MIPLHCASVFFTAMALNIQHLTLHLLAVISNIGMACGILFFHGLANAQVLLPFPPLLQRTPLVHSSFATTSTASGTCECTRAQNPHPSLAGIGLGWEFAEGSRR